MNQLGIITTIKMNKPEVIVLGTIHSQHKTSVEYGLVELVAIVRNVDLDYILAEMPPERFEIAKNEFESYGKIREPRILNTLNIVRLFFRFPEE